MSEADFGVPSEAVAAAERPSPTLVDRLGALAEVVICSGYPTQLFLLALMTSVGMRLQTTDGKWSPLFVSVLSLLDTGLVVAFILLFLSSHRERARDVLIGSAPVAREVVLGLSLMVPILIFASLILVTIFQLAPQLHNVEHNPFEDMLQNRRDAAIFAIVATIAGGVREEIQRGFILHRFRHYLGGGSFGLVLYSAIFGLGHVDQGWDAAITVATLGAIWGTIYLTRRSIIAPMVSHGGFNLAQLIKYMALRQ
ncbi:MAG TPA: type II CAAX endopeptidase family protein [Vicinamibacterales bacterium]|nr:type II CAAX endopeptidase family protein [Vicinamibacterales bacterium]